MADQAREWTDKQLAKIEKQITKNYGQVEKELTKEWNQYAKKADKEIAKLESKFAKQFEKDLNKGNTAKSDKIFEEWNKQKKLYLMKSSEYKDAVNQITHKLANANQVALDYINGQVPDIYAKNFAQVGFDIDNVKINYEGYQPKTIKKLVNEDTIRNMVVDGDVKLQKKKLNVFKDVKWNTKKMNSAVLQGIIKGESIQDMAKRIAPIVQGNKTSAIRNARTIVTGAENRGRFDSYKRLQDAGVVLKKVWLATPDGRTRDWHVDMDGVEVNVNETFSTTYSELEYPGDPGGDPADVYNCRCSMTTDIVGFKKENGEIAYVEKIDEGEDLHDIQMQEEIERRIAKEEEKILKKQEKGILKSEPITASDAFSQERKDNAFWAKSKQEADDMFRPVSGKVWNEAEYKEKVAIYDYTAGSGSYNNPLRFDKGNEISQRRADNIDSVTKIISRSELQQDTWLQRGVQKNGSAAFLDIPQSLFDRSEKEMQDAVLGKVVRDDAFFSCGSSKGSGFDGCIFNVYCPKGTNAMYCEPFSAFGYTSEGVDWDGISTQSGFGRELETLLQRGGEYRVTKVEKTKYGEWYFDIEVVGQNPEPLSKMFSKIY